MSYELVKDVYDDLADHIVFDTAFHTLIWINNKYNNLYL
jgi:acetate kinase